MTVNRIEIDLNGLARLELSMVLDNITVDMNTPADKAMNDVALRTASLVYDDHSLLAEIAAGSGEIDVDDRSGRDDHPRQGVLDALRTGQGDTQNAFDALQIVHGGLQVAEGTRCASR